MERDELIQRIRDYFGLKTVMVKKTRNSAKILLSSPTGKALATIYLNKRGDGWLVSGCDQALIVLSLANMPHDAD